MKPWHVIRSMNRFMELKRTTTNWKICRMKKRRRTSRHCRINSRLCIAISSWNHSMPRHSWSYKLLELEVQRAAEEFRFRNDVYPISQMRGVHAQIPTFLINIHKVDNEKDARGYIARLNAIPKLFDQVIVNLRTCEGKGVVAPKFGFPLVLEACHKIIGGVPFDDSGTDNPLLADFKKKAGALKGLDEVARSKLIDEGKSALSTSVKPAYEKLIAFLEDQSKRANNDAGVWKFPDGAEFYTMAL